MTVFDGIATFNYFAAVNLLFISSPSASQLGPLGSHFHINPLLPLVPVAILAGVGISGSPRLLSEL